MNNQQEMARQRLLSIGAQHPATPLDDPLVRLFNELTANARLAVGAIGNDEDEKADWCSREIEGYGQLRIGETVMVENDQWPPSIANLLEGKIVSLSDSEAIVLVGGEELSYEFEDIYPVKE